jgi:hypothetical protein
MAELIEMRDGSTATDSRLGRLRQFDERSRNFAVAEHPLMTLVPVTKVWEPYDPLDQGPDGTCIGHGFEGDGGATPVAVRPCNHDHALKWFDAAALIDPWPNTASRADGTSVLAGAKIGVQFKFFKEYRWCFSKSEVYAALQEGPVVVGTNWLSGMFTPDSQGRLHIEGSVEGGHCWLIYGLVLAGDINPLTGQPAPEDIYLMQNSWGSGWGVGGRAWLTTSDFEKLRLNGGEVCVPVGRTDPYYVAPAPAPAPQPKPKVKYRWVWDRFRGWIRVKVRALGCRKARPA